MNTELIVRKMRVEALVLGQCCSSPPAGPPPARARPLRARAPSSMGLLLPLALALGCSAAAVGAAGHDGAAPAAVTVTVGALQSGPAVAPNFVGLSIEVGAVLRMIGEAGDSAPLASLLRHLHDLTTGSSHPGPTLRFGGNSADDTAFLEHPDDPLPPGCSYGVTEKDLAAYVTFASKTAAAANVSLIIDTNFGTSTDPFAIAVPHVKAVVGYAGLLRHVSGVEIGNEMDIYFHQKAGRAPHRNASYTEKEYEAEFATFLKAYEGEGGLPTGLIQGATYASASKEWGYRFAAVVQQWASHMASVSLHRYATSTCSGVPVTRAELLSDAATRGKVDAYRKHIDAAIAAGVPFVIGEGNTASCGGQPGVSDTLTAALWSLDFLPTLSQAGSRRMNFHGGPGGSYPPIAFLKDGSLQARPLYYGLHLFSELVANHSRWLQVNVSAAGQSPAPTPASDPSCKNGIRENKDCCAEQCGSCGGPGCNDRPGSPYPPPPLPSLHAIFHP